MSIWEVLERAAYTGLGLVDLAKEKLDEVVEKIEKEKNSNEDDGRNFAKEVKEHVDVARRKFNEIVAAATKKVIAQLELAKSEDLEALKKRVLKLEKNLMKPKDEKKA